MVSPENPAAFYPQVRYDLRKYADGADNNLNGVPTSVLFPLDGITGASKLLKLVSPTVYREPLASPFLTITHPPTGALFPCNLCAPFVEWTDIYNDLWQVTLGVPEKDLKWTCLADARRWRIPDAVWREVVQRAGASDVLLRVRGVKRRGLWGKEWESVHASRPVRFRISEDPADGAIVYRLVAPPFFNRITPDTFVRDIRTLEARPLLLGRQEYCISCHTFSSQSGWRGKLGLQVRYSGERDIDPPTYLAVCDLDTRKTIRTILPFKLQMTTFMSWSPDETKLAFAANQRLVTTWPLVLESQNAEEGDADLAIYDVTLGKTFLLPGASESGILETFPRWTPDGKHIVFSRAPSGRHPLMTHFELYVIPYRDGRGGTPVPVPGASGSGKSNIYPRFSPDGKWMTFVRAEAGALIKSSSDIYISPSDLKGPSSRLESNADCAADSWYSWSSNSRWIVFSSKRDDGLFARLYLTHIDEAGQASPAVRLPLAEEPMMTFNIPEFLAQPPTISERTLFEGIRAESPAVRIDLADEKPHE